MLKPIKKESVRNQVFWQLSDQIIRRTWPPGSKLPSEYELSWTMGVSRVSIREGIQYLVSLGILETRHGEGTFVRELSQKFVSRIGHVYGPHIHLIGKKLWDSFPAGDQKVIAEAAQESAIYQRTINRKMNRDFVDNLRKAGVNVTELTPEQHKAFVDAVAPVYATWKPKIGKALLDEFRATVNKAR